MSREEAIQVIRANGLYYVPNNTPVFEMLIDAFDMAIEALESQQWIPCSDHLPKESGTYFVTAYDGHCKRTSFMKYQKKYQRWDLTGTRTYWKIMAWMPLPGSWEGEES